MNAVRTPASGPKYAASGCSRSSVACMSWGSDGVLDGRGDAVEQFADFVDGQWYQFGLRLDTGAPFCVAVRVMMRKAAAAMDSVMHLGLSST